MGLGGAVMGLGGTVLRMLLYSTLVARYNLQSMYYSDQSMC